MSVSLQTELCRLLSPYGPVHTAYAGGQAMNTWVAGSTAPFTRGASYDAMVENALGIKPERVILQWFQGESDTTDNAATAIWITKLNALIEFLKEDFDTEDVRAVVAKIYPQSDLLPLTGNYVVIRDGIDAWAAASPDTRRAVETSDLYRPTANVHLSEWSSSGPGSSLLYAARAVLASLDFYN